MFDRFLLTLVLTHDCNMRCHYCYAGSKARRIMPEAVGDAALQRALASIEPHGKLELGFFGGEPLLEPRLMQRWMNQATQLAQQTNRTSEFHVTTNGTVATGEAWEVLSRKDLRVAVSADGIERSHNRHRIFANGNGTFDVVQKTVQRLLPLKGKELTVIMVIHPDTVQDLAEGIRFWHSLGVYRIEPTLDLWATWTEKDAQALQLAIGQAADVWAQNLPNIAVGWFDDKAVGLSGQACGRRCSFGEGELTITPAGNLYPCERLVGDDADGHPMRLPGNALDPAPDFLMYKAPAPRDGEACRACTMAAMCSTFCRCANYVRTGDVRHPDGLLCLWNQACLEEVEKRAIPVPTEMETKLPFGQEANHE